MKQLQSLITLDVWSEGLIRSPISSNMLLIDIRSNIIFTAQSIQLKHLMGC